MSEQNQGASDNRCTARCPVCGGGIDLLNTVVGYHIVFVHDGCHLILEKNTPREPMISVTGGEVHDATEADADAALDRLIDEIWVNGISDESEEQLRHHLTRERVPDGWVPVPKEPTEAMLLHLITGCNAVALADLRRWAKSRWEAVIAAAPNPGGSDD